jgi:hypothetical protein
MKTKQHVNKSSQQKGFFAAHGLCPANRAELRAEIFCPAAPAHYFCKSSYAPATRQATTVLPAFARSCFADAELCREEKKQKSLPRHREALKYLLGLVI